MMRGCERAERNRALLSYLCLPGTFTTSKQLICLRNRRSLILIYWVYPARDWSSDTES